MDAGSDLSSFDEEDFDAECEKDALAPYQNEPDTYLICPELAVNIYYELMKIVFFLLYNGGKWP